MSRFEVRDQTGTSSSKAFHVYDTVQRREVFHTDSHDRAIEVAAQAGDEPMSQHVKDFGHQRVSAMCDRCSNEHLCAVCKRDHFGRKVAT